MYDPPHPSEIIAEWFDGAVPDWAAGNVDASMDARLTKVLGTTPGLWLRLQDQFDKASKTQER
jgi:hypothetical protein